MTPEHAEIVERLLDSSDITTNEAAGDAAAAIRELAGEIDQQKRNYRSLEFSTEAKQHNIEVMRAEVAALRREVEVLRQHGNKDCTHMADAALAQLAPSGEVQP